MGAQQVPLSNSGVADPCLSLEQKDDTQAVKAEGRNLGTRQRGRKVTREEQKEESGLLKTHPLTGSVLLGYVSGPGKTKLQCRAGWVKTSNCKLWHDRLLGESPPDPSDALAGLFLEGIGSAEQAQVGITPSVRNNKTQCEFGENEYTGILLLQYV